MKEAFILKMKTDWQKKGTNVDLHSSPVCDTTFVNRFRVHGIRNDLEPHDAPAGKSFGLVDLHRERKVIVHTGRSTGCLDQKPLSSFKAPPHLGRGSHSHSLLVGGGDATWTLEKPNAKKLEKHAKYTQRNAKKTCKLRVKSDTPNGTFDGQRI